MYKNEKVEITLLTLLLLVATVVSAKEYHVSANSNNQN
jgi:hypothetical protein